MISKKTTRYLIEQGYSFVRRAKHGLLYRNGTKTILIAHTPNYEQPLHKLLNAAKEDRYEQ